MDFNTWMMIVGGLVFTAGMFTLIGHSMATDECQRNMADSREGFDNERASLQFAYRIAVSQRDIAEELAKRGIDIHVELVGAILEGLRINDVFKEEHLDDPMLALLDLIKSEHQAVLDVNSPEIKRIINKAKREHGKKVRKAADRKMEKTERAYDLKVSAEKDAKDFWRTEYVHQKVQVAEIRQELSMYQGIVSQELDNYIRLPSVRNACNKAINAQHKAYKDL